MLAPCTWSFTVCIYAVILSSCWFYLFSIALTLQMDVFDAAERYHQEGRQLIILAGKDYGSGSSRDWAAKGPWMQVHRAKLNPGFMDLQALFLDLCTVG